jgi:hypothetical protein|tara:strand:+ start:655 stop:1083 length:429 start_codon:yes stop_codon:yes gene_type:complete
MQDYVNYMIGLGADKIPHRDDNLLSHSIRVSGLLYAFGRPMDEVKAGLFHSIYGTEFQMYKINVSREEVQNVIGVNSERIVNTFCTLNDRVNTILYGKGLTEPDKTSLRWLEYCNIRDQEPEAIILKEFEVVLPIEKNQDII